jgi:phosphonate transport system substrate-binding protein
MPRPPRADAPEALLFASLAADNLLVFHRGLAAYLSDALRYSIRPVEDPSWQVRERQLLGGQAHLGVVCGLQYVYSIERGDEPGMELLAAPVMRAPRYGLQPVYFSDVVVRAAHPARSFDELSGARFAFNERTSHSGYGVVRHALSTRGYARDFFGSTLESGSHQRSLALIVSGAVDASAIDSTVLEAELCRTPALRRQLRVVATLGPSPIPPLVVSRAVRPAVRQELREVLLGMHRDPRAAHVLASGRVQQYVPVQDSDYDPIRAMATASAGVAL